MGLMRGFQLLAFSAFVVVFFAGTVSGQIRHEVFLPNTDHELHVYRVFGEEPGKTIMIIGGIQGDEPGSYLTADLYADIHLKKGNLIVVPRANLYSILLNRREGLTGDMNRKFGASDEGRKGRNLEKEVVTILKHLIAESDCLLNLHEGSGYYNPVWVSAMENPSRYGQSVIFDTEVFSPPGEEKVIRLGDLARKVVDKVNAQISEKRYLFRVNNHDTLSAKSPHKEQRKSATFYALTNAYIPAFGVETSKSIESLETKISLHKLVINTAMEEFGIILDSPGVTIERPKLDYLLVKVNGGHPVALPHGSLLKVDSGDDLVVTEIIANYERGLVADIEGFGTRNDTNKPFRVTRPTRVIVRKDAEECGWVDLLPQKSVAGLTHGEKKISVDDLRASLLIFNVNGALKSVTDKQTLHVNKGSWLIMEGIQTNIAGLDNDIMVNFKGFAPPKPVNDGNDLHYTIYTDQDLWRRYSVKKLGKRYPVEATYNDKVIGEFWVEIE